MLIARSLGSQSLFRVHLVAKGFSILLLMMWSHGGIVEQVSFIGSLGASSYLLHLLAFFVLLLIIVGKALRVMENSEQPKLIHSGQETIARILSRCPSLFNCYHPTKLWGKCGHIQTLLLSKYGRFGVSRSECQRQRFVVYAEDGASVTYDLFTPSSASKDRQSPRAVVLVVPGIGNHSDTVYVQGFTRHCTDAGFDVAIYNHLGAVTNTKLTSPRVFTYGGTDDLDLVVNDLKERHDVQCFIGIGFSMGANILLKYLGEKPHRQTRFLCAASVCQGYDIARASELFLQWENMRRGYNYAMTQVMKSVLMRHADTLSQSSSLPLTDASHWQRVKSASSLHDLDEYMKCFDGFDSATEFYRWSSSSSYMAMLTLPVLLINAHDDPMVPEVLLTAPKRLVARNPQSCLVVTKHGGHLGFFEGGLLFPNSLSWIDRVLVEYIDAVSMTTVDH